MPTQLGLPNALTRFGLTARIIDGWGSRGSSDFHPRGSVSHWTASGGGPSPSLGICINGRAGLPGPLCNVFLDRNGIAYVVSGNRANHAGAGGYNGMSGNSSVFGTECEGTTGTAYAGTDFTPAQLVAYPKIVAAYHYLTGTSPLTHACGHSEWTSRKIDIGGYAPTLRQQAAAILAGGPITTEDDDMTPEQSNQLAAVYKHLMEQERPEGQTYSFSHANNNAIADVKGTVDDISSRLRVPGYPFDWLPAINNNIAGLDPAQAVEVDVESLAASLKASLADDIVQALAEKLSS